MLMDGQIRDPGVRRIQRLHDYLSAKSGEQKTDHQPREASAA